MSVDPNTPAKPRKAIRILAIVAVIAGVILGYGVYELIWGNAGEGVRADFQEGYDKAFYTSMRQSCIDTATQQIKQQGHDVEQSLADKIANYCNCVTDGAKAKMTPASITAAVGSGSGADAATMNEIVTQCRKQTLG